MRAIKDRVRQFQTPAQTLLGMGFEEAPAIFALAENGGNVSRYVGAGCSWGQVVHGGDSSHVALVGHSDGAHLIALATL
jgi:hypothetical protein